MKKIIKSLGLFVLLLVLLFGGFLGYMTLTQFSPPKTKPIAVVGNTKLPVSDTLDFLIWNIGYAGLGAEQDFFFDGGKGVRPKNKQIVADYLQNILSTLTKYDSVNFILLQEVDKRAKRSYQTNQVDSIKKILSDYNSAYAVNYKTQYVPQPVLEPYGQICSGLLSLSKHLPKKSTRYKLAPDAGWPVGLFMLKRCFLAWRFPLNNGKVLVVVNLHLSAYDDGTVKQQQLDTLSTFLNQEHKAGNYVVVGGDWNMAPPNTKSNLKNAPENYPNHNWQWIIEKEEKTNRSLDFPLGEKTKFNTIDYYLVSKNIAVLNVKAIDLGFNWSDHQPVYLKVALKQ